MQKILILITLIFLLNVNTVTFAQSPGGKEFCFEFFFEIGVLLGLVPDFGSAVDVALGMRFYP